MHKLNYTVCHSYRQFIGEIPTILISDWSVRFFPFFSFCSISHDQAEWNGIILDGYFTHLVPHEDVSQLPAKSSINVTISLVANGKADKYSSSYSSDQTNLNATSSPMSSELKTLSSVIENGTFTTNKYANSSASASASPPGHSAAPSPAQPSGLRTLRIIQMPEEKRWTVEISSTIVPNHFDADVIPPDGHGSSMRTPCLPLPIQTTCRRNTGAARPRRGRKGAQTTYNSACSQTWNGHDNRASFLHHQTNSSGWFDANMSPMLTVYSVARKNKVSVWMMHV